jgi:hypothetical protein
MPDKDVYRSQCPLSVPEIELNVGEGDGKRRFSISCLIHRVALKTGGGERLAESKQHLLRRTVSMSKNAARALQGKCEARGCL